ncbi:MAG: ABC transporter ATP-binding protein [Chloroflexota bacterium]
MVNIENAVKRFGSFTAVDGLSFNINRGIIFGLLGPNGAGKTTTIRMITNILAPDEGRITVDGQPFTAAHGEILGYLPEERGLYKKLKVIEQIVYFGRLKGMSASDATAEGKRWLEKFGARGWENKKVQELSKGMQQKVQFIATVVHDPKLLILDEPFSGFDPINAEALKSILLEMRAAGKTIVLSTHVMEQVEKICDEIVIINKGKAVLQGPLREVKERYGRDSVLLEYSGDASGIEALPSIRIINKSMNRLEFRIIDHAIAPNEILKKALEKLDVYKFELSEPSLNEIFIAAAGVKEVSDNE